MRERDQVTPVYGIWSEHSLIVHLQSPDHPGFTACGIDLRNMSQVAFDVARKCRRCLATREGQHVA